MSIDVRVPTTGNAGEDAVIVDWNVSVGSQVSAGDVLVTLETAKATIEVEAPSSGEILKILFDSGDEVPEHEVLAILGEAGESLGESGSRSGPAADADDPGATAPASPSPSLGSASRTTTDARGGSRVKASPRARILAERNEIDLAVITGTGPGGRIIIADVLAARARQQPQSQPSEQIPAPDAASTAPDSGLATTTTTTAPAASTAPAVPATTPSRPASAAPGSPTAPASTPPALPSSPLPDAEFELVPVRGARKVTAERMLASLQSTAQVTLTRYADATAMLAYVRRLRAVTETQGLPKIGVNDVVLFATARAVARHPEANSTFAWDGIRRFRSVHLGFAVGTDQALLVPVIPVAERLTLAELAAAAKSAIEKSRTGKLTTAEMEGGTFTVSNLGSLGVHWFTPVLNPPQSCILGIGAAHHTHPDAPSLLPLSLTFDHRALDGAAAALVLADIAKAIETVDVLSAF
jgi:pyruvate dehydrogenase E2 component (dihydrolipoamide acetyltransferase)